MKLDRHGISVGIERVGEDDFFVTLKLVGKLTHADYEQMVPMLESAIAGVKDPDIYVLCDITELEGWEARAMWDDLKLDFKHGRHFEKIAVIGDTNTQEWLTKVANWFTSIKVKFFLNTFDAIHWLKD
ncbi:STAS/SEC14 domain-containing protein [Shewanella sp. NFH-SH190041]|uniref:STAS/SEC14 domain-containing protein n=1 Tax=Shewanella sp. NFH-SH190041 TaxID=2950245 RepID=UPI0021C47F38|nr:STAS/SEC14 domain-containing protein [Shewanella sp. NFH-SH190041]BDM65531.1 STAS/SEC14 domain-containing protein [Shewanella sp. NFH-SH190041]